MKRFEHINHEMRKIISNYLSKGKKAVEIANDLGLDVSAVSKEIKRNRIVTKEAYSNSKDPICEKTTRFPYVCNGCSLKYSCHKKQYKYDTKRAQEFADNRLIASRSDLPYAVIYKKRKNANIHAILNLITLKSTNTFEFDVSLHINFGVFGIKIKKYVKNMLKVLYKLTKWHYNLVNRSTYP